MIRLLVVDDSALMRRVMAEVFARIEDVEPAFARSGEEALALLDDLRPDVITLDVNMPGLNGLETLDRIMLERPCPVVMVSSLTQAGAEVTLEALELGAVDFVPKPQGALTLRLDSFAPLLVETVRRAAAARVRPSHRLAERMRLRRLGKSAPPPAPAPAEPPRPRRAFDGDLPGLALVGCSTGGPPALEALLGGLPADFPWPVLVAQHIPASFTGPLARRLDGLCALEVIEAARATRIQPGVVYIARGDADLVVGRRSGGLVANPAPESPRCRWHPSVDRLVASAMQHMPAERLAGVLMTGMGDDGAAAMAALKAAGGWTVAEAEETAVVWGMPGELARRGGASLVAPRQEIAAALVAAVAAR